MKKLLLIVSSIFMFPTVVSTHNYLKKERLKDLHHHELVEIIVILSEQNESLKEELHKLHHTLHEKHKVHELEKAIINILL